VLLSLLPFREGSGPLCFLEVTSDIRERVRWRRQMIEIEKLTSMGKMAAGTAHHLNSPLAALLIRTELIRRHSTGPAFDADLARIEEGLHFCRHFVQRLLDFTRAMPLDKSPQDLAAVIESIAGFFQPAILARHATLVVDTAEGRGQFVFADRNLLETLLLTLLSNALDAVPAGGEIRLRCRRSPGSVGFTVSDNGSGISPAHLEHVFEPFFTTKEPGKGTGLGLATAYAIIRQSGGAITVASEVGRGTAFHVYLPRLEAGVTDAAGASTPAAVPGGSETVLIVEDRDAVRQLTGAWLARLGYRVLEASNGPEAIELASRHRGRIDLLLADVILPLMSGQALTEELLRTRPGIKVLYISGYAGAAVNHGGMPDGSWAFLAKPFRREALAAKVREVLAGRGRERLGRRIP